MHQLHLPDPPPSPIAWPHPAPRSTGAGQGREAGQGYLSDGELSKLVITQPVPGPGSGPAFRPGGQYAGYLKDHAASAGITAETYEITGQSSFIAHGDPQCLLVAVGWWHPVAGLATRSPRVSGGRAGHPRSGADPNPG